MYKAAEGEHTSFRPTIDFEILISISPLYLTLTPLTRTSFTKPPLKLINSTPLPLNSKASGEERIILQPTVDCESITAVSPFTLTL